MAFKLVIGNTVQVKVAGYYTDEKGVKRKFDFTLDMDRMDQDELKAALTTRTEDATETVRRLARGWNGQRLVLTEDDKPADFSPEAMDKLMTISGMGGHCWQAYLAVVMVNEKN